jgi:hypothetical protein
VSSKKHSKDELQAMINDARAYAEKERKKKW